MPCKQSDILTNNNCRFYQRGKSYGLEVELLVAAKYLNHKERLGVLRSVVTQVAAECHFGKDFVFKIECELMENDRVLTLDEIYIAHDIAIGPGSKTMAEEVLYQLYWQEPTRSMKSYIYWLFCCTGTIMSKRTVSRWFNHAFPIRGRFCVPNLVP
jgi:hypothetical protein